MKELLKKMISVKHSGIDKMINFIYKESLFLKNSQFKISYKDEKPAAYSFVTGNINIPQNKINKKTIDDLQRYLPKKSLEFVVCHEIGHAVHHQSLVDNKNYIYLNNAENLNNLLSKNDKNNPIEGFIHSNFAEAYADCYACFALYLETGDINVFSSIFSYRNSQYNRFKNARMRFDYNKVKNICEISQGSYAINRYFAYYAITLFKKNVVEQFSIESLKKMPYEDINDLMQVEIISGVYIAFVKELNENDLFYRDMLLFLEDKDTYLSEYFNSLKIAVNEARKNQVIKLVQKKFIDKIEFSSFKDEDKEMFFKNNQNLLNKEDFSNIDKLERNMLEHIVTENILTNKRIIDFANDLNFGKLIPSDSIFKKFLNKEMTNFTRKSMNFHVTTASIKSRIVKLNELKDKINIDLLKHSKDEQKIFINIDSEYLKSIYLLEKEHETTLPLFVKLEEFKNMCKDFISKKVFTYLKKKPTKP